MPVRAVVLARTHLTRQPIAQSLSLLGLHVQEFSDLSEVVANLNTLAPNLIVMDADGMDREWRLLASGLGMSRVGVALVLLTSRFGFDDAHVALERKVGGVIVKPFRKEEHSIRLLEMALNKTGVKVKRSAPRFAIPEGTQARLRLSPPDGDEIIPVENVAEGGLAVRFYRPGSLTSIQPGAFISTAVLTWGDIHVELSLEVAHRSDEAAGMRIHRALDGKLQFMHALEEQYARALGSQGKKRKW